MKNLIEKSEITAVTAETVIEQIVNLLRDYGFDSSEESEFAYECKEGFGEGEFNSRVAQTLLISGEMNGDWQTTIKATIFENHSISTDEYFYTVTAVAD